MKVAWMCQTCPSHDKEYYIECPVCRLLTQTILRNLFGKKIGKIEIQNHDVRPLGLAVLIGKNLGWLHQERVSRDPDVWTYAMTKRGKREMFSKACYGDTPRNLDCVCADA